MSARKLHNGRVSLALHELKPGEGTPLLLLHELYGSSRDWGDAVAAWPGPVFALDFCGHGESDRHRGGSYHIEHFISAADVALRELGRAVVAGAGIGAWYGLMLSGARANRVPACLLAPGVGLEGSGARPDPLETRRWIPTDAEAAAFEGDYDPYVVGMEGDPRPPSFIEPFATAAQRVLLVEACEDPPPWWKTVRDCGSENAGDSLAAGLEALAHAAHEARAGR